MDAPIAAASSRSRCALYAAVAAETISRAGNLLTATAIPWFVLVTTGSAAKTGVAVFAGAAPVVVALFFGGTIVDRLSYRRVSIVADLASGLSVMMIPLLYATVGLVFWQLLVFVFLGALLDLPASLARTAALPDLARSGSMRTERAFAIVEGGATAAELAAPAVAGVLIATLGASNVLWIDAVTFGVSALLVAAFVPHVPTARAPGGYVHELLTGLRFVRAEPVLFPLILCFAAANIVLGPIDALVVPVYANQVFDSSIAFGLMAAAGGVGSLAGTVVFGWIGQRMSRRAVFLGGFLGVPLALGALAFLPNLAVTLFVLIVLGLGLGLTNLLEYTIYFERIPEQMRARVLGLAGAIGWCTVPVSRLLGGYLLERVGLSASLALLAVAFLPVPLAMCTIRALQDLAPKK